MLDGVCFGLLGPLQLRVGSVEVPLGTPKQRAVLAVLLLSRNRPVSIESLIDAVWNNRPPDTARTTVYTYVSNLRRLMADAGMHSQAVLASSPPGYRLAVPDSQCDVATFTAHKNAGLRAASAGRFDEARGWLSSALAMWRGDVLADLREFAFVDVFADALTEDRVIARTVHAEAEIGCGRANSVIGDLEALGAEYPYRESVWAQLITAYYVADRQSEALEAYHRLKARLSEDLGADPGPTLRELYQRILRQQPLIHPRAVSAAEEATVYVDGRPGVTDSMPVAILCDASGHQYPILDAPTRIGRSAVNEVVLSDVKVSRLHAVIVDTAAGFVITDVRSANGVFVSGRRVRGSAELSHGDRIRIGDHELTFLSSPEVPTFLS
ncbi:MAG: BTAD domain-containing putative transcriptional regulator [Mycobacterium sp.]